MSALVVLLAFCAAVSSVVAYRSPAQENSQITPEFEILAERLKVLRRLKFLRDRQNLIQDNLLRKENAWKTMEPQLYPQATHELKNYLKKRKTSQWDYYRMFKPDKKSKYNDIINLIIIILKNSASKNNVFSLMLRGLKSLIKIFESDTLLT